jgi:LEA14-like dessication related protein
MQALVYNYRLYTRLCLLFLLLFAAERTSAKIKEIQYIGIADVKVKSVDLHNITFTLQMSFYNPNRVGVRLKDGDIDTYCNNKYIGKALVEDNIKVPSRDTFTVPITIVAAADKVLGNAFNVLAGNNKVLIKLNGTVKAGKLGVFFKIPVYYEGEETIKL